MLTPVQSDPDTSVLLRASKQKNKTMTPVRKILPPGIKISSLCSDDASRTYCWKGSTPLFRNVTRLFVPDVNRSIEHSAAVVKALRKNTICFLPRIHLYL